MESKKPTKQRIKEKILYIINIENRSLSIREITNILRNKFKLTRSQPMIKKYLDELVEENKIKMMNG